ncbi:GNAT family N-acetyltransferase [Sphingobacterium lactis]|uniref:N-acetyltransferase domain-containing protein n=1 Tax=Sphingobacterium lactis TaxID=797291 RepID=A0A1H5X3U3_9SPHI|nr:GNAT family N-acetyltransferase [Sphingobacterium lactis]SEG05956.1 hypothetical protein SAMN05421877_104246 [Sphingobacterium lactis]
MKIINNEENLQFEYAEGDEIARLEYRFYKKDIALMHTVVPESMAGKGVATALAERAFAFAKEKNKKVMVYCPFVAKYVKKHPELRDQIDRDYHPNL